MGRPLLIVALVGMLMAGGVAGATPAEIEVRLPISTVSEPGESQEGTVVVEKGDHLWKISARHLDRVAPESDIAPYWRDVVDVNTPRLRSGDPDLIYPGEVVELPATTAPP
jgi:nucleoid-associated protein YgaU